MMGLFQMIKSSFGSKTSISDEPDYPIPFGMKIAWLAIKADNPEIVMDKMGLNDRKVSNWKSAFQCIENSNKSNGETVFVTPCFDGYVLILNVSSLLENKQLLDKVASQFEEVQYFATMRTVGLSCWARYFQGELNRRYYYADGETYWNEGELTKEEIDLGLISLPKNDDWSDDTTFPDEDTVCEIASKWGIDPFLEKFQDQVSTGYLCDWYY